MGRNEKQNQEQRERARAKLLDAAAKLFADHGVAQVSTARIAQEAGVSKGLVYHYFPTKDAIFNAVLERHIDQVLTVARQAEGPPQARLQALAAQLVHQVAQDPAPYRLLLRTAADPEGARRLQRYIEQHPKDFEDRAAAFAGVFGELRGLSPSQAQREARFFQASLVGILVMQALSPRAGDPEPLVERLFEAIHLVSTPPERS